MSQGTRLNSNLTARVCACRGFVIAAEKAPEKGVRKHQLDEPHKSWDYHQWQDANTSQQLVTVRRVR